jgi:hypothetical protein
LLRGFGRVGRSLVGDLPRYQALYSAMVTWLDGHGISVAGLWAEHFNVGWLLRATQQVTTRVNTTLSFWVIVLVYVMLGLFEVENIGRKVERLIIPPRPACCSTAARGLGRRLSQQERPFAPIAVSKYYDRCLGLMLIEFSSVAVAIIAAMPTRLNAICIASPSEMSSSATWLANVKRTPRQ